MNTTVTIAGQDWVLAQLSYAQVQSIMEGNTEMIKLMETQDPKAGDKAIELRDRCIVWSLNNAHKWPDVKDFFGSETTPFSITAVKGLMPFPTWGESLNELHMAVLRVNKLLVAKDAGEAVAEMEVQPTGAVSAAS